MFWRVTTVFREDLPLTYKRKCQRAGDAGICCFRLLPSWSLRFIVDKAVGPIGALLLVPNSLKAEWKRAAEVKSIEIPILSQSGALFRRLRIGPRSKQRRANPHNGGPFLDRHL